MVLVKRTLWEKMRNSASSSHSSHCSRCATHTSSHTHTHTHTSLHTHIFTMHKLPSSSRSYSPKSSSLPDGLAKPCVSSASWRSEASLARGLWKAGGDFHQEKRFPLHLVGSGSGPVLPAWLGCRQQKGPNVLAAVNCCGQAEQRLGF